MAELIIKLINKADELYQRGFCDDAVDVLVDAIKQNPDNLNVNHKLAELLIDSGNFSDAFDILKKLKDHVPTVNSKTLAMLGYCKGELEEYEAAEVYTDQAISLERNSPHALYLKGTIAAKTGDKAKACKYFEESILRDTDFGLSYTALGKIKWNDNSKTEALDCFEKGVSRCPRANESITAYHSAIIELCEYGRGGETFQIAVSAFPHSKRLRYLLIDVLLRQSKHLAAMEQIENAIQLFGIEDGIIDAAMSVRAKLGPLKISKQEIKADSVSLCMIVKNEEHCLANCLESIKKLIDEIIIVDTGSTDKTREIATAFGARVYDFPWADDFSAARNYSISKALGNKILILDADEIIAAEDHARFRELTKTNASELKAHSIVTRNYTMLANTVGLVGNDGQYAEEEAGSGWYPSEKVRLFPNNNGILFEYPVHEMVDPCLKRLGVRIEKCEIPIHHYGKLGNHKNEGKGQKYLAIGRKKLEDLGDDAAAIRELAVQAGNLEQYKEAVRLWQKYIDLQPESPEAYVNIGSAYWYLGNFEMALVYARKAIALAPAMKEAYFNHALAHLLLGKIEDASKQFNTLARKYPDYLAAEFMLAAALCCDGERAKAIKIFSRIKKTKIGSMLAVTFIDLGQRFISTGKIDCAVNLIETALESGVDDKEVQNMLNQLMPIPDENIAETA